jgi:site-specific DNA-methyltransferase (adenine-specific)
MSAPAVAPDAVFPPDVASRRLAAHEATIERGLHAFLEVGRALREIRDGRLYRAAGWRSFGEYVTRRWPAMEGRAYADRLIGAAAVVENLTPIGVKLPANEAQARALTALKAPELQAAAWRRAVAGANGSVTARHVEAAVRAVKAEQAAASPRPPAPPLPERLEVADATLPWPAWARGYDLCWTSPPYGLDRPYAGHEDQAEGWAVFMADWLGRAFEAGKDSSRLALNVPLDTTRGGFRATWPEAYCAATAAGWAFRTTIVWDKGNSTKGNRGLGSTDSANAPHPLAEVEVIGLFSKGPWKQASGRPSDVTHEEWQAWGDGLWTIPGETRPWEGHPAPFPEELAYRIIRYLSHVGDIVCDPFLGSGTAAAVARRLGREAVGFDRSAVYVESARRRLARERGIGP